MDLAGGDKLLTSAEYHELGRTGVRNDLIETRRRPTSLGFADVTVHHRGDRIAFEAFPELQIEVADVLGDRP
jgi:hypothetical protein